MANLIQSFKDNCSNFLYIFITDDAAREVFSNAPVILKKRQNQIAYVIQAAKLSKYSYNEIRDAIGNAIVDMYGKKPGEILLDIANGKNVYSLKEVRSNIAGIGAASIGKINIQTGYPEGKNKNKYTVVVDPETNQTIGVFELNGGKQVSYYDPKTGLFKAGKTPSDNKESRNMWVNNIDWNNIITAIINLIGRLFGVREAQNIASYQSDGWYGVTQNTTQNSTNNILPIALLAVAGYYLVVEQTSTKEN